MKYLCRCDCGGEKAFTKNSLVRSALAKNCGCVKRNSYGKNHIYGSLRLENKRLYNIWNAMIQRCHRENQKYYHYYGKKGIAVCDEWRGSFESFLKWSLINGYKEDLTIDRIDVKGNYTPDNCRWADRYVQARNKGIQKNNKTGVTGVSFDRGRYISRIKRKTVNKKLGTFKTLEEAKNARLRAEKHYEEYGSFENL